MTAFVEYVAFGARSGYDDVCRRTASAVTESQLVGWQVRTMRELRAKGYEILGYGETKGVDL